MKLKKLVKCSLATALIFGSVGAISGCKKDNNTIEKTQQEEVYNLYVQYMSAKGETPLTYEQWLESIKGEKGEDGISPKVRINETTNEWEISTDNGVTWTSTGVKATGENGQDLATKEVTVTYNFNLGNIDLVDEIRNNNLFKTDGFEIGELSYENKKLTFKMIQKTSKGDYFDLYDYFNEMGIGDYFDGWYVGDVKVNELNVVANNIELIAKWKQEFKNFVDINNSAISYRYESDYTAFAYPTHENATMYLKNYTIHNGKLYQVTNFSIYKDGQVSNLDNNSKIYASAVYLPDSLSDLVFSSLHPNIFLQNKYTNDGSVAYFTNNAYYDIENETMVYTIKDYAILVLGDEGNAYTTMNNSRIQFVYKIDYSTNTAKLITTYRHPLFEIDNNLSTVLGDVPLSFNILKDGDIQKITVTELKDWWFAPGDHMSYEESLSRDYYMGFLIGETEDEQLNVSGSFLTISDNDPSGEEEAYLNYKCVLFLKGQPSKYEISGQRSNIYYYSETEPIEEGNYWHYGADGKTPVIWKNE